MKSQALHTVSCNISWSCCRGNLIMITLGSERVEFHHPGQLLVDDPVFRHTRRRSPLILTGHTLSTNGHRRAAEKRSSQTLQSKVLIRPCRKLGWNGESRWIGIFGRHFGIHKYQISFKTWPSPTVYGGWPSKQLKERKKVLSWSHARRARFAQETACHWLTRVAPPPGDSCSDWHFPLQRPRQPPTRRLGWRSTSCHWKRSGKPDGRFSEPENSGICRFHAALHTDSLVRSGEVCKEGAGWDRGGMKRAESWGEGRNRGSPRTCSPASSSSAEHACPAGLHRPEGGQASLA